MQDSGSNKQQKKKKQKKATVAEQEPGTNAVEGLAGVGVPVAKPHVRHLGGGLTIKDCKVKPPTPSLPQRELCSWLLLTFAPCTRLQLGSGPVPTKGKLVKILYEGRLANGKVFDSNQNSRKPLSFRLGLREVVSGMDKGVEGMRVGGVRDIKIPPAMGYGNRKTGPIPANSELQFTVELVGIGGKGSR